jgi:hypothetical protein
MQRSQQLVWISELVYAESAPGAGVAGLITGSGGMGKTTLAIRAAHVLRPSFPGGVFFLDLFGMSPQPAAAADALLLLLRALGVAEEQIPEDVPGRASVYRSLLRDRHALVVLDNAGSEEQVRPLEVAWDALDELVDLGLLLDSAAGRYRFHDLVRLFARTRLEEEESPAEREALTARVTSSRCQAAAPPAP